MSVPEEGPPPHVRGRPFRKEKKQCGGPARALRSPLVAWRRSRTGGLAHSLGDDADLLDAGALGGIDHLHDVPIPEAPAPMMNIVFSLRCRKIARKRSSSCAMETS